VLGAKPPRDALRKMAFRSKLIERSPSSAVEIGKTIRAS
jgi:hypothetical protein